MKTTELPVFLRDKEGKGAARSIRTQGLIPAIIYGDNKTPQSIQLDPKTLLKEMHIPGFSARLFNLKWDKGSQTVLCKKVDFEPVSDRLIHADFMRVADKDIKVNVAVNFTGREKCLALKQGGSLTVFRRKLTVICAPDSIPDSIDVSLDNLTYADSILVNSIQLPKGVRLADTRVNYSVAILMAPRVSGKAEDAETPAAKPAAAKAATPAKAAAAPKPAAKK